MLDQASVLNSVISITTSRATKLRTREYRMTTNSRLQTYMNKQERGRYVQGMLKQTRNKKRTLVEGIGLFGSDVPNSSTSRPIMLTLL